MGGEIQQNQINNYGQAQQNMLVNPGFEIWQRGNGAFTALQEFTADEWEMERTVSDTMSVSRVTDASSGDYALSVDYTRIADNAHFRQSVENYKSLEGGLLTFSIDVKTDVAGVINIYITDTGGLPTANSTYHSGSGNWERLTIVKEIPTGLTPGGLIIPHGGGLAVGIRISDTVTNARFDNASLVVGNFPQGVPFIPLNRADDFQRCQRFYEVGGSKYSAWADIGAASVEEVGFTTEKAAAPTLSWSISSSINHNAGVSLFLFSKSRGMQRFLQPSVTGMVVVTATWDVEVT